MTLNNSASVRFIAVAIFAATSAIPALGQSAEGSSHVVHLRGGITVYETGSDVGCTELGAPGLGVSIRTGGPWFVGMSGEAYYSVGACTDEGAMYQLADGRWYTQRGQFFLLGPRVTIRAGHTARLGPMLLDVSTGVGSAYSFHTFDNDHRRVAPWAGFAIGISRGRRFGLEVQRGWQWVEIEHVLVGSNTPFERFRQAVPATEIFFTYRR